MQIAQFNYTGSWGTRACSQTSRTNNGTLTISSPLWVTQMRGLRNLYLSYPPLSLWVTLVYIHPLRVTLVYFHPLRVTLVYFHPPRVTHLYILLTEAAISVSFNLMLGVFSQRCLKSSTWLRKIQT